MSSPGVRALSGLLVFVAQTSWHGQLPALLLGSSPGSRRPPGDSISLSVNTLMAMRLVPIRGMPENLKYVIFHDAHVTRPPGAPFARQT
jgi:hypothetical protein